MTTLGLSAHNRKMLYIFLLFILINNAVTYNIPPGGHGTDATDLKKQDDVTYANVGTHS